MLNAQVKRSLFPRDSSNLDHLADNNGYFLDEYENFDNADYNGDDEEDDLDQNRQELIELLMNNIEEDDKDDEENKSYSNDLDYNSNTYRNGNRASKTKRNTYKLIEYHNDKTNPNKLEIDQYLFSKNNNAADLIGYEKDEYISNANSDDMFEKRKSE